MIRRLASVSFGLALAFAALRLAGCSSLDPNPPNPHDTSDGGDPPDPLDGDPPDASEDAP